MTDRDAAVRSLPPTIRRFNPGALQSDQAVIDQFVVRHHELSIAMDILRGNVDTPSSQHALVVAPRGRGKTMLLARVAAELRTDAALSRRLLPVRFMEESQEIYSLGDFWLETLFQLGSTVAPGEAALAEELRETHAALSGRWRDSALPDLARAAVLDTADRLGRRLVLMVENLQSLCQQGDPDFGWQLRSVLQSTPEIILLASATTRFRALDDAEEPFFELFRIIDLKPLDTEGCRRLWEMARGEPVLPSEVRPLEILTGGSPRFLVFLAGFTDRRSLGSLMEELVTIIDQHTEYFRGHLEALPRGERRVFVALIDLWMPSTAGEIAARARMDIRVVSTMLARLIDRGVVVADPKAPRRGRLYGAAEPLYSIYYKLRRERDEAAVVESLVHFMVALYDDAANRIERLGVKEFRDFARGAFLNGAFARAEARDFSGEILTYRRFIALFESSDDPALAVSATVAQAFMNMREAETGRTEEALAGVSGLAARVSAAPDDMRSWLTWWAAGVVAMAHTARGEREAARAATRQTFAAFGGRNESPTWLMLRFVFNLLAVGATESELLDILAAESSASKNLAPLIVALRQATGEAVRAPAEVLAVAADLRKRIDEHAAKGELTAW